MSATPRRRLPRQVEAALALAQAGRQIERIQRLWTAGEHSFALLVVWMRIEALLKLLRYHDKIDEGWPKELNFITASWTPLKRAAQEDSALYAMVFRGDNSLWKIRNQIVHGGFDVAPGTAAPLGYAGEWVAAKLSAIAPQREHLYRRLSTPAMRRPL